MKEEDHHHKNSNFSQDGIQLSAPIIGSVVQNPLAVAAAAIEIEREEESIIDIDVTDRDGDSIIA
jgi:uncharacterized Rossmann fold enzyme